LVEDAAHTGYLLRLCLNVMRRRGGVDDLAISALPPQLPQKLPTGAAAKGQKPTRRLSHPGSCCRNNKANHSGTCDRYWD
jgi:hypothetical protein